MIRFEVTSSPPKQLAVSDFVRLARILSRSLRTKKSQTVAVRFVTKVAIQALNTRHRGIKKPTDVLSFSTRDLKRWPSINQSDIMGDIVICSAYAAGEARRRHLPLKEELIRLLVHGVLHLAGYDHTTEKDELQMFRLQEMAVEKFFA